MVLTFDTFYATIKIYRGLSNRIQYDECDEIVFYNIRSISL